MKKLQNVSVFIPNLDYGRATANFTTDDARFHIWFDYKTMERDGCLYKNPPHGVAHRGPGYFQTRTLDATNPTNAPIVTALFAEIEERKLIQAKIEEMKARDLEQEAAMLAKMREYQKQQTGPELYDALKGLMDYLSEAGATIPPGNRTQFLERWNAAKAAIAKAEAEPT
jgi:hypothetical protein